MKYLWALLGLLDALLSIYVGYLFVTSAVRPKLTHKGLLLQAAPLPGGIALALVALPLVWSCLRLVAIRTPPLLTVSVVVAMLLEVPGVWHRPFRASGVVITQEWSGLICLDFGTAPAGTMLEDSVACTGCAGSPVTVRTEG